MPRTRKPVSEVFFDVFADMPLDEQGFALKIMTELHRQAKRDHQRRHLALQGSQSSEPEPKSISAPKGEDSDGIPF